MMNKECATFFPKIFVFQTAYRKLPITFAMPMAEMVLKVTVFGISGKMTFLVGHWPAA